MTDTLCNCMSEGHQQANDKANKTTKTMTIDEVILAHRHMLTMQIESCFCVKASRLRSCRGSLFERG